ncbi:hypothetical protein ACH5RR_021353 [Cinchona calisaya]|uniref:Uncharacterized protein n=1 Tax=Cinchona calisaya TaxID=153742 RepID=A0ABD2ZI33_9GENT
MITSSGLNHHPVQWTVLSICKLATKMARLIRNGKIEIEKFIKIQRLAAMGVEDVGSPVRYAVVTGANKGIGLETVRQLSTAGVTVILTARNEKRGKEATSQLHQSGEQCWSSRCCSRRRLAGKAVNVVQDVIKTNYEAAKVCLDTNYYGVKNVTEALLPLQQRSISGARIVNVSSLRSELNRIPSKQRRKELGDRDTLTEEKINAILQQFLQDLKHDALEANGWQMMVPAYSISNATLNAYTRVVAKKFPNMGINCVHPGFVKTDLNFNTGTMTVEEGAAGPVMLSLLPQGGPTGCYFDITKDAEF